MNRNKRPQKKRNKEMKPGCRYGKSQESIKQLLELTDELSSDHKILCQYTNLYSPFMNWQQSVGKLTKLYLQGNQRAENT
jgi:hypothetical protein